MDTPHNFNCQQHVADHVHGHFLLPGPQGTSGLRSCAGAWWSSCSLCKEAAFSERPRVSMLPATVALFLFCFRENPALTELGLSFFYLLLFLNLSLCPPFPTTDPLHPR